MMLKYGVLDILVQAQSSGAGHSKITLYAKLTHAVL